MRDFCQQALGRGEVTRRHLYYAFAIALSLVLFHSSLQVLVALAFQNGHASDYYSHIPFIPLISAFLIYFLERKKIFAEVRSCLSGATMLSAIGLVLYWFARRHSNLGPDTYFSPMIFAIVTIWIGAFLLCYGVGAARAAAFPLLFLLLVVPIPQFVLAKVILWLQQGSANSAHALFELSGVPVLRENFLFFLPGVTIEVAEECSGIHSTLAVFIFSLLAGHLFLRTSWSKFSLILVGIPIVIVKNAVRIVGLSLIAVYLDPSVFRSPLHRYGGIPLFLVALMVLGLIIRLFGKLEKSRRTAPLPV